MKPLRLWLLIVLAVLMPVRGALASAWMCPIGKPAAPAAWRMTAGPMPLAATDAAIEASAHHRHGGDAAHRHDAHHAHHDTAADTCDLCAAFCSMTPLIASTPGLAAAIDTAAPPYPEVAAPSPSFLSDRQERPPRSI